MVVSQLDSEINASAKQSNEAQKTFILVVVFTIYSVPS